MKYIVDFYKDLDIVNLIVFWGIIIVVLLLLTFAIIMVNKNKKLKEIIKSKGIDINNYNYDEELAIKKEVRDEKSKIIKQNEIKKENIEEIPIHKRYIKEEKFAPEELVMEYNKNKEQIEKTNYHNMSAYEDNEKEFKVISNHNEYEVSRNLNNYHDNIREESSMPKSRIVETNTYQNNTIKDIKTKQISPVGIVKKEDSNIKEINSVKELQDNLNHIENENRTSFQQINNIQRQKEIAEEIKKYDMHEEKPRGNYLEEISKSLSKITSEESINRTEYELRQEEDAIISYKELMEKKDSIKTIDEEEAVISIEELMSKKNKEDKLYNITNDAEDDKFIDELKNFRSNL